MSCVLCLQGHVTFDGVAFAYPLRPDAKVLSHLTLDVEPGKVFVRCRLCAPPPKKKNKNTETNRVCRVL